jgi:hypothetical protein
MYGQAFRIAAGAGTTLTDPDMRIRCAIGAQNAFAADFHS